MNPTTGLPLKDIHLPPAVSAWPPAPGWWIMAVALIAAVAAVIFFIVRHRRRTAYRRAALAEARLCGDRFRQHQDKAQLAADCSELLRRVAIAAYGKQAAGVAGTHWINFLDTRLNAKKIRRKNSAPGFSGLAAAVLEAPYRPAVDYDAQALQQALQQWIRYHKPLHKVRQ
jgi:hypothetical protein